MGQRQQSEKQKAHRKQFAQWMGRDNRIAMKSADWLRDHGDKLRQLERDNYERKSYGIKVLG